MAARMARRPRREIASALAAAARRWRTDSALHDSLPVQAGLSAPVVAAGVDVAAEALDAGAMGDVVNVLNTQSKRTIQGIVSGPGRVNVTAGSPRVASNAPPAPAKAAR